MKLGSLFTGIGGFELGLRPFGIEPAWQVEYESFATKVLEKHWPDVTRYGDIKDVDWSAVEPVDIVTGGFPCQPISSAGKQRGINDDMWLWPEFERCLRAIRPQYVLVENSPNLTAVNDGKAFTEILGDLATLGYDVRWGVLGAYTVGAPHKRDRIWIFGTMRNAGELRPGHGDPSCDSDRGRTAVNADTHGRRRWTDDVRPATQTQVDANGSRICHSAENEGQATLDPTIRAWGHAPKPAILGMGDGVPWRLDPHRRPERVMACGNAVVPVVVAEVWRQAMKWDRELNRK